MDPRIPMSVQPLLQDYRQRLRMEVPDLLLGLYVHGSIPYDAFCEQVSDIDVLAVTVQPCCAEDLARLRRIHADLKTTWPRLKLEASYIPQEDCRQWQPWTAPPYPHHHEGRFVDSGIFDFNSRIGGPFVYWMLKARGITLLGPEPDALGIQISASDIVAGSLYLVENYWPQWTRPWRNLSSLRHPIPVDWAVFSTLRAYYTIRERDIASKPEVAEYGLEHLPERWHWLIRETLENRLCPTKRGIITRMRSTIEAILYLRFILRECQRVSAKSAAVSATSDT